MVTERQLVEEALPSYEIRDELGRGAFGIVLAGRHRALGRAVAIKQLPRAFSADPSVRDRFVAESQVLASFEHPHIARVYDFVEHEGLCLLVMEQLTGGTLWERSTGAGLTIDETCAALLAASTALQYAHERGVLHRDVKPENLMFSESDVLKLTDFGIAKLLADSPMSRMTATGMVVGTPAYMAPEQATAGELGPYTDVYATGIMGYELLAGVLPFPGAVDSVTTLLQHVQEDPRPLREVAPAVPEPVAEVIHGALARDPADRYATADDFGTALAEAATAAFGAGWLERCDIPLVGATRLVAITGRASGDRPKAPTAVVRATAGHRAAAPPTDTTPAAPAPAAAPPTTEAPEPPARPTEAPKAPAPATVVQPAARPARARRGRVLAIAGAVLGVIAVVAVALFALGGGGGGSSEKPSGSPSRDGGTTSGSTTSGGTARKSTTPTGTAPAAFMSSCQAEGRNATRCACLYEELQAEEEFDGTIESLGGKQAIHEAVRKAGRRCGAAGR